MSISLFRIRPVGSNFVSLWHINPRPSAITFLKRNAKYSHFQANKMSTGPLCASLLEVAERCDSWPYRSNKLTEQNSDRQSLLDTTLELRLEDGVTAVGLIVEEVAKLMKDYGSIKESSNDLPIFIFGEGFIKFHPELNNEQKRTSAVKEMVDYWREKDFLECLRGWRNEIYPVYYSEKAFNDSLAFTLERSASWAFGVATFGVHVNGYTCDTQSGELKLWVARRSPTKSTWPNYLDNTCAGGISHGDGIFETVIKECQEEGSVPKELAKKAKSVGAITYTSYTSNGVSPETQYVYDLELPVSFKPTPNDGEVGAFHLMSVTEILAKLKEGEFKPNCGLVIIDFLIRHGHLTTETEPNISLIQSRCHRPSPFYHF